MKYDYIIVGAGSAGCVLADRLTVDGTTRVLLIEAGGRDWTPAVQIPKALKFALTSPKLSWNYETAPFGPNRQTEIWPRGKVVGGSSAINGMVWNRGLAPDYAALEALGNPGWGWDTILPIYKQIEDHGLGGSDMRGAGGPLHISINTEPEPLCEVAMDAAEQLGLRRSADVNASDEERIGYTPGNIKNGRRFSAARAFLAAARKRPGLDVLLNTRAVGLVLEGERVVGVRTHARGRQETVHRAGEIILALGTIGTPQLLEMSGIGAPRVLEAAGIRVAVASPLVGERMREHRAVHMQWQLNRDEGYNPMLRGAVRQGLVGAKYLVNRRGMMGQPAYDLLGFFKTRTELERVDTMFMFAPLSLRKDMPILEAVPEDTPGVSCAGTILRPESEGSIHIRSADPYTQPAIHPGYLTSGYDRTVTAGLLRKFRELAAASPLAERISHETFPGPQFESEDELADKMLIDGNTGYHAIGTCAMGSGDDAVVDSSSLRVRGIEGLRVMDASVLPIMPAGNTNAPVMAMAWHAADLILGRTTAGRLEGTAWT